MSTLLKIFPQFKIRNQKKYKNNNRNNYKRIIKNKINSLILNNKILTKNNKNLIIR